MKVSLVTRYIGNPFALALCQLGKSVQTLLNVFCSISVLSDQYKTKNALHLLKNFKHLLNKNKKSLTVEYRNIKN